MEDVTDSVTSIVSKTANAIGRSLKREWKREFHKVRLVCPFAENALAPHIGNIEQLTGCVFVRREKEAAARGKEDFPLCLVGKAIDESQFYIALKKKSDPEAALKYLENCAIELVLLTRLIERTIYEDINTGTKRRVIKSLLETYHHLLKDEKEVEKELEEIVAITALDSKDPLLNKYLKELEGVPEYKLGILKRGKSAEARFALHGLAFTCLHALFALPEAEQLEKAGALPHQDWDLRKIRRYLGISLVTPEGMRQRHECKELMSKSWWNTLWKVKDKNLLNELEGYILGKLGDESFETLKNGMNNLVTTQIIGALALDFRANAKAVAEKFETDEKTVKKRAAAVESLAFFHQLALIVLYARATKNILKEVEVPEELKPVKAKLLEELEAIGKLRARVARKQERVVGKLAGAAEGVPAPGSEFGMEKAEGEAGLAPA